ncbi:MAG: Na+/H+ antiporter NhaC family protein [Deltaproteobacteria bacterium]|nr:Na+/H+ antiporter NhaC family protein [Deltaproteobacteria bacterium]MCB9788200.1 Na+/H+ antiporter NhaC family protein [Deltaproteobacteria bacterium]
MRDMSIRWPRWIGFLIVSVVLTWGLGLLEPDTERLASRTWTSVASDLAGSDELQAQLRGGLLPASRMSVDGGVLCEEAARGALGGLLDPASPGRLAVHCSMSDAAARLSVSLLDAAGKPTAELNARHRVPSGLSLLPPLLCIIFAFFFHRVVAALLLGITLGAFLVEDFAPMQALWRTGVDYLWGTAVDPWNLKVYAFTLVLLGMVNVSIVMGGMNGVLLALGRLARGVRSTQVATALMGVAIFFDDYANAVVVGGAARPLTDARRISREKLAYIVDSTAAPVAGIAFISTWIGIEIKYFQDTLPHLGVFSAVASGGYAFFFEVLPYRFYCIFAVLLVFMIALMGRDFGPMLTAERMARRGERSPGGRQSGSRRPIMAPVEVKDGAPARWVNGVLPIALVVLSTIAGSIYVGARHLAAAGTPVDLTQLGGLGQAFIAVGDESVTVLLASAGVGALASIALAVTQRILGPGEALGAWLRGAVAMLPAVGVLILAMAIRAVTEDLMVAPYIAGVIGDMAPRFFPLAVFVMAGGVAFATGTSWGTMAILIPVALPVGANLFAPLPDGALLLFLSGAAVLDGAIFGDHCSLISDTTVMSSIASGCEHVEHVRTQLPYALLAMSVAALAGYTLVAWTDADWWLSYPVGLLLMAGWLRLRGKKPEPPPA